MRCYPVGRRFLSLSFIPPTHPPTHHEWLRMCIFFCALWGWVWGHCLEVDLRSWRGWVGGWEMCEWRRVWTAVCKCLLSTEP